MKCSAESAPPLSEEGPDAGSQRSLGPSMSATLRVRAGRWRATLPRQRFRVEAAEYKAHRSRRANRNHRKLWEAEREEQAICDGGPKVTRAT